MEDSDTDWARSSTSSGISQQDVSTDRLFSQIAASGQARQQNGDSHDNSIKIFIMTGRQSISPDQSAAFYQGGPMPVSVQTLPRPAEPDPALWQGRSSGKRVCRDSSMLPRVDWPREEITRGRDDIQVPAPQLSRNQILQQLTSSPQNTMVAAENYSRLSRSQGRQRNISSYLMGTRKFEDWFRSRTSRKLVVQPPCTTFKTSPGSFAAATLHREVFSQIDTSPTLAFFCGAEKSETSGMELGKVLMANLLYQIILASSDHCLRTWTNVTSIEQHEVYLRDRDMDYMCGLFEHLIKESEFDMIFCLIDDVRCLEDENTTDTTAIFEMLQRLTACSNQEMHTAFKLILFTAYNKGLTMASTEQSDIVSVREADLRKHSQSSSKRIDRLLDQHATC